MIYILSYLCFIITRSDKSRHRSISSPRDHLLGVDSTFPVLEDMQLSVSARLSIDRPNTLLEHDSLDATARAVRIFRCWMGERVKDDGGTLLRKLFERCARDRHDLVGSYDTDTDRYARIRHTAALTYLRR